MKFHTVESGPFGPHGRCFVVFQQTFDFIEGQGAGDLLPLFVKEVGRSDRHVAFDQFRQGLPTGVGQLQKDFGIMTVHDFHHFFVAFDKPLVINGVLRIAGASERMRDIGMGGHDQADAACGQLLIKFQLRFGYLSVRLGQPVLGGGTDEAVAKSDGTDFERLKQLTHTKDLLLRSRYRCK